MNLIFLGGLFISIILLSILIKRRKLSKKLKQLRDNWGVIPESGIDIETAEIFFQLNNVNSIEHSYLIDDDT